MSFREDRGRILSIRSWLKAIHPHSAQQNALQDAELVSVPAVASPNRYSHFLESGQRNAFADPLRNPCSTLSNAPGHATPTTCVQRMIAKSLPHCRAGADLDL